MTDDEPSESTRPEPARWRRALAFSPTGLIVAALFFAASLMPSLLPRSGLFQGIVSGITVAIGYGLGVFGAWLWRYVGLPPIRTERARRVAVGIPVLLIMVVTALSIWRHVGWQNDLRSIFGMDATTPAVWLQIVPITLVVSALLLLVARGIRWLYRFVDGWVARVVPPRVARVIGVIVVVALLVGLTSGVLVDGFFAVANQTFSVQDDATNEGNEQPDSALRSGSPESEVPWETLGRQGRRFVSTGPTVEELDAANGGGAVESIRVYVGLKSADTLQERADLLLEELQRTGAFEREVLVLATTTGTGFLEPGAMNSVEYLHNGDTAIAGVQYSYLPSWISLLADQAVTRETSLVVFDTVHRYWASLPEDERPEFYLFGLSLGSYGVEAILRSINMLNAPIEGALLTGPPFVNPLWNDLTANRDAGSPASLPVYEEGRTVRFTAQRNALDEPTGEWGDTKVVYLQHASDPVSFFSPDLAFSSPEWLGSGQRGPDVSSEMTWFPLVTMWQVALDLPVAGGVPTGYGHLYTGAEYLSGWVGVTDPDGWTGDDTARLEAVLADRAATIEE